MIYNLDGIDYEVVIERKNNKHIYIRVKEDMKIHVSCSRLATKLMIKHILDENVSSLRKMVNHIVKQKEKEDKFFYLGKEYDIIVDNRVKKVFIDGNNIYTKNEKMLEKWLKEETLRVFDDRYVFIFNHYDENIKSPILKIRNMKTRWGVYNRAKHTITLNAKLIEFDYEKIDYVIIHELSHIKHFDHSKAFWALVGKYCKNYKQIRKEMKD